MDKRVSFDEDTTLGMPPARPHAPGGLVGLVMKLGLANSVGAANVILIGIALVAAALAVLLFYRVAAPTAVTHVYDPTDPVLRDQAP